MGALWVDMAHGPGLGRWVMAVVLPALAGGPASGAESRLPGAGTVWLIIAKPFGHGPGVQEQALVFGQGDDRIFQGP